MTDDFKLIIGKLMNLSINFNLTKDSISNVWIITSADKNIKWEVDDVDEFNGFPHINFYSYLNEFSDIQHGSVDWIVNQIFSIEYF